MLGGDDVAHLVHHVAEALHLLRGAEPLRPETAQSRRLRSSVKTSNHNTSQLGVLMALHAVTLATKGAAQHDQGPVDQNKPTMSSDTRLLPHILVFSP